MKTQLEKIQKEQFNTRIPVDLKRGMRIIAVAMDWTVEDMTEVAMRTVLGAADHEPEAKLKAVRGKAKALNLSFSLPDLQPAGLQLVA